MTGLIDSHFHLLALQNKGVHIGSLLEKLFSSEFYGGIDVGLEVGDLKNRKLLTQAYPTIIHASGAGPWAAERPLDLTVAAVEQEIKTHKGQFLGEIGLDNHWNYGTPEQQEALFSAQLELATTLKRPVIIHNREADRQMELILNATQLPYRGIMHCFSGNRAMARTALNAGLSISFAGPITYKKNTELRDILTYVPDDRLLLETDSPYLSPEPQRGLVNTPLSMPIIYQKAAEVRRCDVEHLIEQIQKNFTELGSLA